MIDEEGTRPYTLSPIHRIMDGVRPYHQPLLVLQRKRGHGRVPPHQFTAVWKGYGRGEIDWCGVRPYRIMPVFTLSKTGVARRGRRPQQRAEDHAQAGAGVPRSR
ncbi:MAG: hypothetical protein KJ069_14840 [Anaerolineae bacterium]|nr:hypothetical protein [Anaerolineae bacterium]